MFFLFISAAVMWIAAVLFMFRVRHALTANDQTGVITSIRMSRILFLASMGCIVAAINMKVGNTMPFYLVAGLAAVMCIKFVVDILSPGRIVEKMKNSGERPNLHQ